MPTFTPFIDRTYFTGELTIGQVEQDNINEELMQFVRKYEYDFLLALMGKDLFTAFYNGMQGTSVDDRWKRIAYGYSFELDSSKVKTGYTVGGLGRLYPVPRYKYIDKMNVVFRGLLKRANSTETDEFVYDGYGATSPIAKCIYYWWNRAHVTASGGATESAQQVHNGTAVINNQKVIKAWNEMCYEVFQFYLFMDMHAADYPEFTMEANARYNPAQINEFNFL